MKNKKWITEGFEGFRAGTFGNGGQNIYVSRNGVLQRIHQTDITRNGYLDLVFCNSQNHEEKIPLDIYSNPVNEPEKCHKLHVGGSYSGCVADLNGNGYEDLILSCVWDGLTVITNSAILYGSEEGLSNKHINYLPTVSALGVTAGDFNGNGQKDLVFFSATDVKVFYQDTNGFQAEKMVSFKIESAEGSKSSSSSYANITTLKAENGKKCDSLLIRKKDGSYLIVPGKTDGIDLDDSQVLLGADEDFEKIMTGFEEFTQAVLEPEPRAQFIEINNINYLCAFRKKQTFLYPYKNGLLGEPLVFNCKNAYAVAVGDIRNNRASDLVFACRDKSDGWEKSWIYPQNDNDSWNEKERIPLPSCNACDVLLYDFSGNGKLDIVIGQSHTQESYSSTVKIFSLTSEHDFDNIQTSYLPAHDAYRIFCVNGNLVINNCRSGSLIGDADVTTYVGGPEGFKAENKISFPAWGCVDMVCCDLNDNGFPDLVLANASELSPMLDPGSFIYYNSQNGFELDEPQVKLKTTRAHGVVCGDLNHNGYLDLIFSGFRYNTLTIFHGSQEGFLPKDKQEIVMEDEYNMFRDPRFMALADLNGNGYLDLLVPVIRSNKSFVLWGGPGGFSFKNKTIFNVNRACNVKVADLTGNGYPDIIFGGGHCVPSNNAPDSFIYIYWGSEAGFSEDRRCLLPSDAVNSIAVADFNNNGLLDIFVGIYQNGRIRDLDSYIYWNQGDEGFLAHKRTPLRTHAASGNIAADFNGNGWIDLAVANHKVDGNHIAYSTVWHNGPEGFKEENVTNLPTMGPHNMGNVDVGNIMDRSPHEYYISAIYHTEKTTALKKFFCKADIPDKSNVTAQFRFGSNETELLNCPWYGPRGLESWFNQYQRINSEMFKGKCFQYKLCLSSVNAVNTPRIKKVIVETIEK